MRRLTASTSPTDTACNQITGLLAGLAFQPAWNLPESFTDPLAVFVRGGHPPQPPGCAGDRTGEERDVIEEQDHA